MRTGIGRPSSPGSLETPSVSISCDFWNSSIKGCRLSKGSPRRVSIEAPLSWSAKASVRKSRLATRSLLTCKSSSFFGASIAPVCIAAQIYQPASQGWPGYPGRDFVLFRRHARPGEAFRKSHQRERAQRLPSGVPAPFLRGREGVGHGARLDIDSLPAAGHWDEAPEILDTLDVARILMPAAASHSLPLLATELGFGQPRPHRALDDADATRQLLLRLREEAVALDENLKESMLALVAPYAWPIAR